VFVQTCSFLTSIAKIPVSRHGLGLPKYKAKTATGSRIALPFRAEGRIIPSLLFPLPVDELKLKVQELLSAVNTGKDSL
jgi:hypothetical protein